MTDLCLVRAEGVALDGLLGCLRGAGLPHDDVRDGPGRYYLATVPDGPTRRVGCGGFEVYDRAALLRSVVVDPPMRGAGHGRALVEALLDELRAVAPDVEEVWLLTTRSAPFFERLAFEPAAREAAPEAIRSSHEFAEVCPASATAMYRSLAD